MYGTPRITVRFAFPLNGSCYLFTLRRYAPRRSETAVFRWEIVAPWRHESWEVRKVTYLFSSQSTAAGATETISGICPRTAFMAVRLFTHRFFDLTRALAGF